MALVALLMLSGFVFGVYKIEKAALTDEHYWVMERTPKFWKNLVVERDFNGTRRSDKPGVTLMVLDAPSLLKSTYPIGYVENNIEHAEEINFAFRLPVLLFAVFSLIVFYILLTFLFKDTIALWGTVFIGLSPILIGMSRIVNPDSLLWIFCSWSIFSYFIYIKNKPKKKKALYWLLLSGFFMGLGLLTKYVATILYIYFLGVIFLEYIFQKTKGNKEEKSDVFRGAYWSFIVFCFLSVATFAILYPAVWVKWWRRIYLGTIGSQSFEPFWKIFAIILLVMLIDIVVSKAKIFTLFLDFLEKYKKVIGKIILLLFLLITAVVFLNVYTGEKWFDYETILSSPKSSFETEGKIAIFLSNFYPLVFGISPLILFFVIWLATRSIMGKFDFTKGRYKFTIYLFIFILLYHLSSVFSNVASTIRYQIILFPIILVIGSIGADDFLVFMNWKTSKKRLIAFAIAFVILVIPLWTSKPFYMAYSSYLLPGKYYLDQKDMGYGSYEAAQILNSLENAESLSIWSDRNGVCEFFVGSCTSNFEFKHLIKANFDFYVVSSGRYSRTNRLVQVRVKNRSPHTIRFDWLYSNEEPFWKLDIAGKESNFVKIIKADTVDINTIQ